MMDVDDEDPVVQEVDVYLSKQLADNLYLLQYPVRPAHLNYDDAEYLSAKIKPKQSKLQFELALNTRSSNYARSKGEQIAINVDGPNPGVDAFYSSDKMDKQIMSSLPCGVSTKRFVVAYLKEGELHLTPLKKIVHMRPDFGYMDKSDSTKNKPEETGDVSLDEEEEAKAVKVKFARRETEEAKARRLASYEYMQRKQEEELWVALNHHGYNDPMAENERQLLYAHNTNDENEFHVEQDMYLEKLIPKLESQETEKPEMPNNVLSMTDLKKMGIGDQVKLLMTNAKVIGFNQLLSYLAKGIDTTAVLRSLQQVALLVQGCWVVKSEVLYPKDSTSAYSGAPADMLCRGRDYIMWRFTQNRCIVRKDIASVIKLHAEDVKDMLEQMSRLKVKTGWEFILDFDVEFVSKHPDVVQRQNMIWDAKFKQLSTVLKMPPVDHKLAAQAAAHTAPPKRRRTTSRNRTKSGSERSMSDMSDEDGKGERSRRASGGRGSGSRDRKRNVSGSGDGQRHTSGQTVTQDTSTFGQLLTNENGPNENGEKVAVTNLSAAINRELSMFLRDKLLTYFVLKVSDIKSLLSIELTQLPPGHVLGKGVTEKHIDDAMQIAGGIRVLSAQIRCGEAVYAICSIGDNLDVIRTTLVDKMQKLQKMQMRQLKDAVKDSGTEGEFADADFKKVLVEYCGVIDKGHYYTLRGTAKDKG